MTKPADKKLSDIHAEALSEFDEISGAMWEERAQCAEDRRFATMAGAQYEGRWGEMFANRPRIEINKIRKACLRVIDEYRNNQLTAEFVSKDGTDAGKLASACAGLFRADEYDSGAQEAYLNAFDEAVTGGFGAFRLRNVEDEDEEGFQRIAIEPIYDADSSVYFDLAARRQDKRDATRCFVIFPMPRKQAAEKYGEEVTSWNKQDYNVTFDWVQADFVYLAEYYRLEVKSVTKRTFTLPNQEKLGLVVEDYSEEELSAYAARSLSFEDRKVKRRQVRKYLMTGAKVLEDYGVIAGNAIPIVPVYGTRWSIDGIERCSGVVRFAKDAARVKSIQVSRLVEIASMSAVEKPIFFPEQVAGHELKWADDNIENNAFMLTNPVIDPATGAMVMSGPIGYTKPPQIPPALAGLMQITETDLQDILGANPSQEKMVSNISGKAVELVQARIDQGAFIYIQNMSQAVRRGGEIWLGMCRDVYSGDDRQMKVIDKLGDTSSINLGDLDAISAEPLYDFSRAKFDCQVNVGPATSSRKQAMIRSLMELIALTEDPADKKILHAMAMLNIEGDGVEEVRDHFRKYLVMAGVIPPTDEEKEEMAQAQQAQKPDPQAEYLMANAQKAMADAQKAAAEADRVRAEFSPESAIMKAQSEQAKQQMELEKQAQDLQLEREKMEFEREKMRLEVEMKLLDLAAERQRLEMQLQTEAIRGQVNNEAGNEQLTAVNAQIEALASKISSTAPIVIQQGGQSFEITRTPTGYVGNVKPE